MAGWLLSRAFTAYYSNLEAHFTEFSGLSVTAKVGWYDVQISLDFGHLNPHSFLFSSSLGRFEEIQPTVRGEGRQSANDRFIENDYGWKASWSWDHLELGGERFSDHAFGLVKSYSRSFPEYQEVAGVISMNRKSFLTKNRISLLQWKQKPFWNNGGWFVEIKSLGSRTFSWPSSTISIPLVEEDSRWSFLAHLFIRDGGRRIGNEHQSMMVVVDPSSSDLLLPLGLWEDYFSQMSPGFQLSMDRGRRLYATSLFSLKFQSLINSREFFLDSESLLFPISVENANAFSRGGVRYFPLRIRFVAELGHVVVGKALLQSYKEVYLDNMDGNLHLIPSFFKSGRDTSQIPELSSSLMLTPFIPERFDLDPGLILPPAAGAKLRLDNFLIPMSFTSTGDTRSKRTHRLLLVRRFPLDDFEAAAASSGSNTFIIRGYDPSSISCTGSLQDGIRLFGRKGTSSLLATDVRYASVTISRSARDILIEVEALFEPPPLLPPALADGSSGEECTICCERIEQGEMEQELPACGHSFHANCIQPWMSLGKNTCPNCRCRFRLR
jgi:hypothetical protein